GPVGVETLLPGVQGVLGETDEGGEIAGGQSAALPGVEDEQALLGGCRWGRFVVGQRVVGGVVRRRQRAGVGALDVVGLQGLRQRTLLRDQPRGGNSAPRFTTISGQHYRA